MKKIMAGILISLLAVSAVGGFAHLSYIPKANISYPTVLNCGAMNVHTSINSSNTVSCVWNGGKLKFTADRGAALWTSIRINYPNGTKATSNTSTTCLAGLGSYNLAAGTYNVIVQAGMMSSTSCSGGQYATSTGAIKYCTKVLFKSPTTSINYTTTHNCFFAGGGTRIVASSGDNGKVSFWVRGLMNKVVYFTNTTTTSANNICPQNSFNISLPGQYYNFTTESYKGAAACSSYSFVKWR